MRKKVIFLGLVSKSSCQVPKTRETITKGISAIGTSSMQWSYDAKYLSICQQRISALSTCRIHQFYQHDESVSTDELRNVPFDGTAFLNATFGIQYVGSVSRHSERCNGDEPGGRMVQQESLCSPYEYFNSSPSKHPDAPISDINSYSAAAAAAALAAAAVASIGGTPSSSTGLSVGSAGSSTNSELPHHLTGGGTPNHNSSAHNNNTPHHHHPGGPATNYPFYYSDYYFNKEDSSTSPPNSTSSAT